MVLVGVGIDTQRAGNLGKDHGSGDGGAGVRKGNKGKPNETVLTGL